jgi:ATP-dependent exoDNAse (exonuclease V) beta subunit
VLHDPLQRRVEQAARDGRPVYRELPFVFRTETTDVHGAVQPLRTIHGVIDLLFLAEDGRWTIVDYKTGILPKGITPEADAQRHHVQVGVYAAAVLEMLGIAQEQADAALDVNIQYIRPKPDSAPVLVAVKAAQWAAALERLEPLIGELLEQEGEEAGPA